MLTYNTALSVFQGKSAIKFRISCLPERLFRTGKLIFPENVADYRKNSTGFPEKGTATMKTTRLDTERLFLREMNENDFPALCAMLRDPLVMAAWERTFPDAEIRAWIARNEERCRTFGYGYWLALEKSTGTPVGQIGLLPETIDGRNLLGVGWILIRKFWGNGYALEGAKACLDYAFGTLNAESVIADIRPMNLRSIRVAERLGMRLSGRFDKQVDGKIMPHLLYTIRSPRNTAGFPDSSLP